MDESIDPYLIERGWTVLTNDGQRVGDVTEVHPTYLLVSRGLIFVRDTYVPVHAIEKAEDGKVRLAVTRAVLGRMDWKKPPRTPLELVRPTDETASAVDEASGDDEAAEYEAPPRRRADDAWETEPVDEVPAFAPTPYWETPEATEEPVPEVEGYDTLGVVSGSRLEVENAISLSIQDVGRGRPVVLLHDWLLGQAYWDSLVPRLVQEGYRVVTMDWRGHGASDRPWDDYWPTLHVHDLRTLIRTLDLEGATIVGHGLGGAVAAQYATTYPRAGTRRLILVAACAPRLTVAPDFEHGQEHETVDEWLERLRVDRPTLVRHFVNGLLPGEALDEATTQWLWEMAMRPPAFALIQTLGAMAAIDLRDELASLVLPVTVLQGTADRLTPPALGRALAAAVQGAEYLPFEGAGHLLGLEARAAFEETLLGLLARDAEEDHQKLLDSYVPAEEPATPAEAEAGATPIAEEALTLEEGSPLEEEPLATGDGAPAEDGEREIP